MASKTSLANLALSHLGTGKTIANVDTEKSQEAAAVRVYFDIALETILRYRDWSFARKIESLALVAERPNSTYLYSYRYPSDCIAIRSQEVLGLSISSYQTSYFANYLHYAVKSYELGSDYQGKLVYTNESPALFKYTYKSEAYESYPSDFTLAFSYLLAALVAPRLTNKDSSIGDKCMATYMTLVSTAAAASFNEESRGSEQMSAFEMARNG